MKKMFEKLKNTLDQTTEIPKEDWERLQSCLTNRYFSKNQFLLRKGQVSKGIYFIVKGTTTTYLLLDGNEVHTAFNFENDFVKELESLTNGTPSNKYIKALENTDIIYLEKTKLTGLYDSSPSFQELGRKILEQTVISEQRYASLFTCYSPQERYQHILTNYPELIQKIPLQYLASYLGMARETLSRIRKRLL